MAFYAGKIILHPAMQNPTIVVLNDRNDLDNQLFDTLASCQELLRQKPVQADDREDLKKLLQVASGGVFSPPSRSSRPKTTKKSILSYPTVATLYSSPTRPTEANTVSKPI
jgi:type I restriction enzyme R subunit